METTSMGSSFSFRLERCVTNVPFANSVDTAVAVRQLFCLMKISPRSFYLSLLVPCRPCEQSA